MLEERETKLIDWLTNHRMSDASLKEEVGEIASLDNHGADLATELVEREKDAVLIDFSERELAQINEAFHAMEDGTYGICKVCGERIPYERLAIVPMTDRCTEHAEEKPPLQMVDPPKFATNHDLEDLDLAYDVMDDTGQGSQGDVIDHYKRKIKNEELES